MKQNSGISGQLAVGLIIFSLVFSACSSTSTQNGEIAQKQSSSYSNANMTSGNSSMMSNSSGMSAPMLSKDGVYEEKQTSGERYARIDENPFLETSRAPLSTFSIDVDTASYANVRRYLNDGQLPPKDAVRIEELVNYFEYDYPQPIGDAAVFGEDRSGNRAVESAAQNRFYRVAGEKDCDGRRAAIESGFSRGRFRLDEYARPSAAG
jgi:Ca-activated chloride channel family protein